MIDLRSDTVTKPTPGMMEAMMTAEVGDDVFRDDPTVNALQEKIAALFGMEDALFCPSGTMTNQIAMKVHTRPQDEVICHEHSHIYLYEGGGMASNSMLSPKLLTGQAGLLTADQIEAAINPDDIHLPRTKMVGLENTMNKGGGSIYALSEVQKISTLCQKRKLKLHLDGARFFNALAETGEKPDQYGSLFDSISICFSKGLGAPVGSVLLGSSDFIRDAHRVRKVFGGGMRQAGYLAAACIHALDHHRERLVEDHDRARAIGMALTNAAYIREVVPVKTNIVIAKLDGISPNDYLTRLEEAGILAVGFGADAVRFVTHLDFNDDQLENTIQIIKSL